ncbi:MAG: ribosome small subunit-dependent GTPase A [Candidatus Melainabacteria bacterium HGW-Melainabacteria-1]|nr:MAG: ribosome small subunit-dependent GTPase A [Candidatus Melainabacteria bacterium HGW-Melainabacteria-1]
MSIFYSSECLPVDTYDNLTSYGWHPFFAAAFACYTTEGLVPARLISEHPGLYHYVSPFAEGLAELSGRMRHQAQNRESLPAVGDWVALTASPEMDKARIEAILPRRSVFARKETGGRAQAQLVAANVDTVLLVSALNQDLNLRRIERYLTLAWESGARPVIVLNKADLSAEVMALRAEVEAVAIGVEVFVISAKDGSGLRDLAPYLTPGQTVALLGSSGVGKSTLVNALAGQDIQAVQAIRADDAKGRHTTTHRQLFRLPSGALLLDTPGMRELQLWNAGDGLDAGFADIVELAVGCRYRNCAHQAEQGCAIQAALQSGELDAARYGNFLKLKREEAWVERRADKGLAANSKRRWKQIHLQARQQSQQKYL